MKLQRSEKSLQNSVIKYLKTVPDLWFFKCSDKWNSGLPDLILCLNGQFVAIELKKPGINPRSLPQTRETDLPPGIASRIARGARKIQAYTLEQIEQAKGQTIVSDNLAEIKSFIFSLIQSHHDNC